ncbi:unnamed protein product [Phaeothamnion confervicola]
MAVPGHANSLLFSSTWLHALELKATPHHGPVGVASFRHCERTAVFSTFCFASHAERLVTELLRSLLFPKTSKYRTVEVREVDLFFSPHILYPSSISLLYYCVIFSKPTPTSPPFAKKPSDIVTLIFDPATGTLGSPKMRLSLGYNPSAITIDATGRWLAVSYFMAGGPGGGVGIFPVLEHEDAVLPATGYLRWDAGEPFAPPISEEMRRQFVDARFGLPDGEIAGDGWQPCPSMVHDVSFDPTINSFLLAVDFGLSRVLCFAFDATTGAVGPEPVNILQLPLMSGPRSICWHPTGTVVYVSLQSEPGVAVVGFDAATGMLELRQVVAAPPSRAIPSAVRVVEGLSGGGRGVKTGGGSGGDSGGLTVVLMSRIGSRGIGRLMKRMKVAASETKEEREGGEEEEGGIGSGGAADAYDVIDAAGRLGPHVGSFPSGGENPRDFGAAGPSGLLVVSNGGSDSVALVEVSRQEDGAGGSGDGDGGDCYCCSGGSANTPALKHRVLATLRIPSAASLALRRFD